MKRDAHTVSVVICAYTNERREQLKLAIDSVRRQTVPPLETIVVIDHNSDLLNWIGKDEHGIRALANFNKKGLSGARNTGVRAARGEIVAFLDDDAIADSQWLSNIQNHFSDPNVICVGGQAIPIWHARPPRWFPEEFNWVVGCSYRGQPEKLAEIRNPLGCNMSFRRTIFDTIGGFSEGVGREGSNAQGCEETELCIRARQALPQAKILHDPSMTVYHHVPKVRASWKYFRERCLAEGRSKAQVVSEVGNRDGLSSERAYVAQALPRGVFAGFGNFIGNRDPAGLARAAAIVAGLGFTGWGYLSGKLGRNSQKTEKREEFKPIKIIEVELSEPLPSLEALDPETGKNHGGVFCLLRNKGRPVGVIEFPFKGKTLSPSDFEAIVREARVPLTDSDLVRSAHPAPQPMSVVVATRDRPASLAKCLDSLLRQNYENFDIIVVDNAPSNSATADLIQSQYAPTGRVRYVRDDQPGLGQAHNCGMRSVTAPYVAFTDDDVIADPQWLSALASGFAAGDNVGCVTGLILPAELDTRAQVWTERHGGFGKGFARKLYDLDDNRPHDTLFPFTAGQFGSGANMAFRTDALQSVRGFDSALGAGTLARGGDDLAGFYSVVHAGFQLVYEPDAIVWHHHRRDEEGMRRQAFGYGVGLGAYLTKLIHDDPKVALRLAKVLPAGVAHMIGSSSPKNKRLPDDYPANLIWRERLGILFGIPSYIRSLAAVRRAFEQKNQAVSTLSVHQE